MVRIERRFFFFVLLFLSVFCCFADDYETLNGIWVEKGPYDWVVNNPEDVHLNSLTMLQSSFQFEWDGKKNEGVFRFELEPYGITKLESTGNKITLTFGAGEQKMVLKIISHDVLQVLSHPYDGASINFLCRIGDPSKPSLAKGVINEDRVRFRNKPDLSSGFFYFLEKGEVVEIIGISPEKQKIGDMEEYWYEICIGAGEPDTLERGMFYVMGWVYGAYVDVADKRAFEETHKSGG